MELAEKDREKTALAARNGLKQYNIMAFGLCNAPAIFERLMDTILGDDRCLIYLDNKIQYNTVE